MSQVPDWREDRDAAGLGEGKGFGRMGREALQPAVEGERELMASLHNFR